MRLSAVLLDVVALCKGLLSKLLLHQSGGQGARWVNSSEIPCHGFSGMPMVSLDIEKAKKEMLGFCYFGHLGIRCHECFILRTVQFNLKADMQCRYVGVHLWGEVLTSYRPPARPPTVDEFASALQVW